MTQNQLLEYGVKLLIIFLIMPVHEFAHAWSALKLGDESQAYKGRLTLNPMAHIDIFGALCMFLTGFGWAKPVEVNPLRFKNYRGGMALTALAGPVSNLLVGFLGCILWKVMICIYWVNSGSTLGYLTTTGFDNAAWLTFVNSGNEWMFWLQLILYYFTILNIGLAVFNLIPVPPLDGSKVLAYFLNSKTLNLIRQYQMYLSIAFLALIFTGLLDTPLYFLRNLAFMLMDLLTKWVPPLMDIFL